ncbi:glycosylphosphatidylinositol-anchored lipid protein transfer 5 [Hibiscus trionum]|nr:glycosylphosphatidylinositol-anchored lipid protein transfer 5 [Hibiscus trionum]
MASWKISLEPGLAMAMLTVTVLWARTVPETDCNGVLMTMAPCLDFVSGNSSTPTAACCSKLTNVVRSHPSCLCVVLNGGGPPGMPKINQTQAQVLSKHCNVTAPSECKNAAGGPAATSVPSPPTPPTPPSGSPANKSNDAPPPKSPTSGGSKTKATQSDVIFKILLQFMLLLLTIGLYSSTWTSIL